MEWQGDRLKALVAERGLTQEAFSERVGVSRQAFAAWARGQIPKGLHLLRICRELGVPAERFFVDDRICIPAHRTRRTAKVTEVRQKIAYAMAEEYASILGNLPPPAIQAVSRKAGTAEELAAELRARSGVADADVPLDYVAVFRLLDALGVCAIFRTFPGELKDYAFYTRISGHRVVFINRTTSLLDLNFAVLRECVHAIQDGAGHAEPTEAAEIFCDRVAGLAQLPDGYVDGVFRMIAGSKDVVPDAIKVNILKRFASEKHHAIFGLAKRIEERHGPLGLPIHGADGNIRRSLQTIGDCLKAANPNELVSKLDALCPYLMRAIRISSEDMTARKLGDLLELDGELDAREVRTVLKTA